MEDIPGDDVETRKVSQRRDMCAEVLLWVAIILKGDRGRSFFISYIFSEPLSLIQIYLLA